MTMMMMLMQMMRVPAARMRSMTTAAARRQATMMRMSTSDFSSVVRRLQHDCQLSLLHTCHRLPPHDDKLLDRTDSFILYDSHVVR